MEENNIAYVASPGHSGSTLLDMLLGLNRDIFSTGELIHLPNQYHRNRLFIPSSSNGLSCSCGNTFYDCPFWGKIFNELNDITKYDLGKNPLRFRIAFLLSHTRPHKRFIHSLMRFFVLFIIRFRLNYTDIFVKYLLLRRIRNNELLFKLINNLAGAKYVIDSSKDIFRLHYLLGSGLNTKIIILRRNFLGVSASAKKRKLDPVMAARAWKKYYNRLEKILRFNNCNPHYVSYESLVDNPLYELNKIYRYLGVKELNSLPEMLNSNDYHIVGGNGLRYKGLISITKDTTWKELLTEQEKEAITRLID